MLSAAATTSPAPVPSLPLSPLGIVILSTAAVSVPTLVTLAVVPGSPVVTVPIATVAAAPSLPSNPAGIPKSNTAFSIVPLFDTVAADPASRVSTLPIVSVPYWTTLTPPGTGVSFIVGILTTGSLTVNHRLYV